jgi:hypothetical protein
MRQLTLITVGVAVLVAGVSAADAEDLPKRKPGQWELTMTNPMMGKHKMQVCIGPEDDVATPPGSADCTEPKITRKGDMIVTDVVCKDANGRQIIHTEFTGDMESSYHGDIRVKMDPSPAGMGTMKMTIDGKFIGPKCVPGTMPGRMGFGMPKG